MDYAGGAGRALGLAIMGTIRAYQLLVAPILSPSCRYYPSCSHYAAEAIALHGPGRGSLLAMRRLLRCHPWGGSGYDPVPSELPAYPPPQAGASRAGGS
jgi:putative membrane protein insertion efficiency factor